VQEWPGHKSSSLSDRRATALETWRTSWPYRLASTGRRQPVGFDGSRPRSRHCGVAGPGHTTSGRVRRASSGSVGWCSTCRRPTRPTCAESTRRSGAPLQAGRRWRHDLQARHGRGGLSLRRDAEPVDGLPRRLPAEVLERLATLRPRWCATRTTSSTMGPAGREVVWFDPSLQLSYQPRSSRWLLQLARQYLEYGR
jgi:hypothetical protein